MQDLQTKLETLKVKTIKLFDEAESPKGLIIEHECEECFGVRETFHNKNWKEITPKILRENYDKLPLFSPEALYCFLPSYLVYSFEHFTKDKVCDYVAYGFMVRRKEIQEKVKYWKHQFQFFSKEQLNLLYEFIDLAIQDEQYAIFVKELQCGKEVLKDYIEPNLN